MEEEKVREEKEKVRERAHSEKRRKPPIASSSPETRKKRFESFFKTVDTQFKSLNPDDFAQKLDIIYQRQGGLKQRLDEIDSYTRKDNQYIREQQEAETKNRSDCLKALEDNLRSEYEAALKKMSLELGDRISALMDKVNDAESNFITKDELTKLSAELKSQAATTEQLEDVKKIQENLGAQNQDIRNTQADMTNKMATFVTKVDLSKLSEDLDSNTVDLNDLKKQVKGINEDILQHKKSWGEKTEAIELQQKNITSKIQDLSVAKDEIKDAATRGQLEEVKKIHQDLLNTQETLTNKIAAVVTKDDLSKLSEDLNSNTVDLNDLKIYVHKKNKEILEYENTLMEKTEAIEIQQNNIANKIQDLASKDLIKELNEKLKHFENKLEEFLSTSKTELENQWKDATEKFVSQGEYVPKVKALTEELWKIAGLQQSLKDNTLKLIEKDILALNLSKSDHYNELMNKFCELSGEQKSIEAKMTGFRDDLEILFKKNSELQIRGVSSSQKKENINIEEDENQIRAILRYLQDHDEKIRQSLKSIEELKQIQKSNYISSETTQMFSKQVNQCLDSLKNIQSNELRELFGKLASLEEQIIHTEESQHSNAIIDSFQQKVNEMSNNSRGMHEKAMTGLTDISLRLDKCEKILITEHQTRPRENELSASMFENKIGILEEQIRELATSQNREEKKVANLTESLNNLSSELEQHIQTFSFYKSANNGYLAKEEQAARENRHFFNNRIEKCLNEIKELKIRLSSQQSEVKSFREQNEGIKTEILDLRNSVSSQGGTLKNVNLELRMQLEDQNQILSQKIKENADGLNAISGRLSNKIALESTKTEERFGRLEEHISKNQRSSLHLSRSFEEEEAKILSSETKKQQSPRNLNELLSFKNIPLGMASSNEMPLAANYQRSQEPLNLIRESQQGLTSFQPFSALQQQQEPLSRPLNLSQMSQQNPPFVSQSQFQSLTQQPQSQQQRSAPKLNIVGDQFSSKRSRRI